jgi:hypothetical protein
VSDVPPPAVPVWVHKRDGRQVPFEADKISRALFAASEGLGQPDAFLARELADAVVHFLAAETDGEPPTTAQVADLVVKVVRELGQPALAEEFARHARQRQQRRQQEEESGALPAAAPVREVVLRFPADTPLAEVLPSCVRAYTLQAVFTRDLAAAQGAGLLTLTGLDAPGELAGCVLGPPAEGGGLIPALEEARRLAGRFVALDGPEHLLAAGRAWGEDGPTAFARALELGLRITELEAVVNLNCASPPSWADTLAEGPLFAGQRRRPRDDHLIRLAEELLEALRSLPQMRVDWHLGERDFSPRAEAQERLVRVARLALEGASIGFVFDRPRRPVALAEGMDRQGPAVLMTVGLELPRLAGQAGVDGNAERFVQKLGSLARLALSAAVQKRAFLRKQEERGQAADGPAVTSGFLLDRARLLVAPVGLDSVVHAFTGMGLCAGGTALDFGRQIVQRLRDVLRQDGRAALLETCVDGPFAFRLPEEAAGPSAEKTAGLTPWESSAAIKSQVRAGGALHAVAERGTLALFLPDGQATQAEQAAEWLQSAWQHAEVMRLRLVHGPAGHQQLTFGGSDGERGA